MDHVFSLHAILDWYLKKRKRVYTAFVDYRKAFDLIDRSSLWLKLINHGVDGKLLKIIRQIYDKSKSCISYNGTTSEFFQTNIGVKQGENLSPLLFALFINDFEGYLQQKYKGLETLSISVNETFSDYELDLYFKLFTLLYADDTIILAESAEELQLALDALYEYCQTWHLTVNTTKTKVVIFSRGKVRKYPTFLFGGNELCVCDEYVYLGTTFNYNNTFKKAINKQVCQAKRALFSMKSKIFLLQLPIDIQLELFDHLILPILLYGSEIWGFDNISQIETFFLRFCKELLGVHRSTSNCMAYGELGRQKIEKLISLRMIMFWYRLLSGKTTKISSILYKFQYALFSRQETSMTWTDQETNLNLVGFKNLIKTKLNDINKQEWHSDVEENSQCLNYRIFKQSNCYEKIL